MLLFFCFYGVLIDFLLFLLSLFLFFTLSKRYLLVPVESTFLPPSLTYATDDHTSPGR